LARFVDIAEIIKNDYNISPSRYIQINETEIYRPLGEILDELSALEEEALFIDTELKSILKKIGA